jgi:hypothetical protein
MDSFPMITTDQRVSFPRDARGMESSHILPPEGATHPEYPLERVCVHRYEPCQLTFARHAQQLVAEDEEIEAEASHRGLVLRGETEAALEQSVQLLRDYYGNQINVGEPMVRYHHGLSVEEPHMRVRVRCLANHFDAVRTDLELRGALIVRSHRNSTMGVLLATAPLARLLGYSRSLAQLTAGTAQGVLCLSHYDNRGRESIE